ncbi:type III secretion system inner membrane ring subunit SctD [Alcaligenes endophyticus]|uniref:Type III secretion system inner membrane ring subunit SctD n=1 Tax=Alcaligenes endophyticus TaxID=1929088 RepID=A0ABT8EFM7_9BURK|nr:type III secretion system inner membrane ring subunit SctD [Alcaligenes endophyticus]MCX5590262.1 type III secretion system inner membrane ring subunit SctD [Alcaligenes endophyticus]MDN4120074.1 type III secretion system inner membrane ring subunit SctD [Alcaligenes endophyticus]
MSPTYELRILSGLHQGATAPISSVLRLGQSNDCDILLADPDLPPEPVVISCQEQGWRVGESELIAFNQVVQWGAISITVATPQQPWPVLPIPTTSSSLSESDSSGISASREQPDLAPTQSVTQTTFYGRYPVLIAAVLLLVLGGLFTVMGPWWGAPEPSAAPTAPALADPQQVKNLLDKVVGGEALQVAVLDDGSLAVQGWVGSSTERDALAQALTQIWPMPALQVYAWNEVLSELQQMTANLPVYQQFAIQQGQIQIQGIALDPAQRTELLAQIQARYPQITIQKEDYLLAEQVLDRVETDLHEAGLTEVLLRWQGSHLVLDADALDAQQHERLNQLLPQWEQRFWARVQLDQADQQPILPFIIRSVVSGPEPYVVLADGAKLLQGGTYQGYRLLAIEPKQLVFQAGRRLTIPR